MEDRFGTEMTVCLGTRRLGRCASYSEAIDAGRELISLQPVLHQVSRHRWHARMVRIRWAEREIALRSQ